ncbi:hypothetical protein Tsubulata_005739 [Turnera subulata]|uniref:BHLH domain-containing protein n=1 Tax=Turnera subulata TaxID=218843 RepID=A0A9Q0G9B7_9ROSI|nr:hypothetical protein Tsubulata_005739 [Turnera subulata]
MQPCSREMQGMNSLLQELQNQQNHSSQIQNPHFDPSSQHHQSSNDDFLEQMLSTIPSCSWADLKSPWDINPTTTTTTSTPANLNLPNSKPPRDLSDETVPSNPDGSNNPNNVGFHAFDDSALLATKLRQHQISGGGGGGGGAGPPSPSMAKMLLQQQLMLAAAARGGLSPNDVIDGSSFKSPTQGGDGLFNGFGAGSMHGTNQPSPQHFQHPQGIQGAQNFGAVMNQQQQQQQQQPQASGSTGGAPGQPRQRVRARRGQATDPHSIAERTDKASMLDEIIDYVKFLQLQVKVLSMSRLGGAAAVAPLVADMSSEGGGDCIQANANGGSLPRTSNGGNNNSNNNNQTTSASTNDSLTVTEHQVAKLMEEDMGSAMQYLQGKGLCLMPISLATAISTATCHTRSPVMNAANAANGNGVNNNGHHHHHPLLQSNGEGPSSPSMSVLTVQSATMGNGGGDGSVKDAASVSKP